MRYRLKCGSYTVEATFILLISITVIIAILYYLMWRHDATVIDSTVHIAMDNNESCQKKKEEIEKLLSNRLFLTNILDVKVKSKVFSYQTVVNYRLKVNIPFVEESKMTTSVSHVYFVPSEKMWDYTILKEGWNEIRGNSGESSKDSTNGSGS